MDLRRRPPPRVLPLSIDPSELVAVFRGETIRTGDGAKDRIRVIFDDKFCAVEENCPTLINLGSDAELAAQSYLEPREPDEPPGFIEVTRGTISSWIRRTFPQHRSGMQVKTGTSVCGPRGTTYIVSYDPDAGISIVAVEEGEVVCDTPGVGESVIEAMEKLTVSADGEATVKPMAQEEWNAEEAEIVGDLAGLDDVDISGSFAGSWSWSCSLMTTATRPCA